MASSKDKIGIKRLDHVCWAVERVEDALPMLTELMGMTIEGRFENPEVGFRGVGLRVPGGTAHFELLEPSGESSYLHRFLRDRGPGLHHVTFEVEDIERAASAISDSASSPWAASSAATAGPRRTSTRRTPAACSSSSTWRKPHDHPHDDEQVSHSHEYGSPN